MPWRWLLVEVRADRYAVANTLRLRVMDLRGTGFRDPTALVTITSDALALFSQAGQGFGELVTSHLTMLVAVDEPRRRYVLSSRAYASSFLGRERTDARYLACHLIWAANMIRLARDAKARGVALDRDSAASTALGAQKRFLTAFEDGPDWIEDMRPEIDFR